MTVIAISEIFKNEKKRVRELQEGFHKLWAEKGKPHPNSNEYLAMVKAYYYAAGLTDGMEFAAKMYDEVKETE